MPEVKVGEGVQVKCCACSGTVTFVSPEGPESHPTFFHTLPECERFRATNDVDALLKYTQDCRHALNN